MLLEHITTLILKGNIKQAKAEISADIENAKISNRPTALNKIQRRDLLQAITELEILS